MYREAAPCRTMYKYLKLPHLWLFMQVNGPYDVTIVNRDYYKGRHIVNVKEVANNINAMDHVKSTR